MAKKMKAHMTDKGSFKTRSGYVRKTKPGPEFTTFSMVVSCTWAMYPRIEKTRTPANKQVMVLTIHVIMASLERKIFIELFI